MVAAGFAPLREGWNGGMLSAGLMTEGAIDSPRT
jgi:hypothetical protein